MSAFAKKVREHLRRCFSGATVIPDHFFEVAPGLYRSAQPTSLAQWAYLRSLGVTRIIKLNAESEGSDDDAQRLGFEVRRYAIQPIDRDDLVADLRALMAVPDERVLRHVDGDLVYPERPSVTLVHCTHGRDRTGLVIARWRVLACGWTPERAMAEALERGLRPTVLGLMASWHNFTHPKEWTP